MGWNLPPGCTDKNIDDAINGDEPPMTPEEEEEEAKRVREEMKTRILENNNQMLSDIIDQITKGRQ